MAYGCSGIHTAGEANGLAIAPVLISANDAQKKKYLQPMTEECRVRFWIALRFVCLNYVGRWPPIA